MAVGIRAYFEGATSEHYDDMSRHVGTASDPPDGLLFHASGPAAGGWVVLTFWDSRAHFDRFVAERLVPAMGVADKPWPERPTITELALHDVVRP